MRNRKQGRLLRSLKTLLNWLRRGNSQRAGHFIPALSSEASFSSQPCVRESVIAHDTCLPSYQTTIKQTTIKQTNEQTNEQTNKQTNMTNEAKKTMENERILV